MPQTIILAFEILEYTSGVSRLWKGNDGLASLEHDIVEGQ